MQIPSRLFLRTLVLPLLLLLSPTLTFASELQSDTFACKYFNFILVPLGACKATSLPVPPTPPPVDPYLVTTPPPQVLGQYLTTITPITPSTTTTLVSANTTSSSFEEYTNQRFTGLLSHVHWLISNQRTTSTTVLSDLERINLQFERDSDATSRRISELANSVTDGGSFTDPILLNPTLATNLNLNNFWLSPDGTNQGLLINPDGSVTSSASITATTFTGSGTNLTDLNADNITTGTLAVSQGGTGTNTLALNRLLLGADTNSITTSEDLVFVGGNLGLGTNTPSQRLHVIGSGLFSGPITAPNLNLTNLADGCVEIVSGQLTSIGTNCGTSTGGITSINGLTSSAQTFTTSANSGLALTITSNSGVHTFTSGLVAGYTIPLTASTTQWATAYAWGDHATEGYLVSTNNLSDLANPATSRTNLNVPTRTGTDATGTWGISVTGNANTATTWQTARTLTIGGTGKSVNGGANVSWSLAEIGVDPAGTDNSTNVTLAGENYLSLTGQQITASAINLAGTNVTGTLPVARGGTGITSLGTGVTTALGINIGTAGSFVTNGGALGTPSSATLTNATGLPIIAGTTGTLTIARGGTGATTAATARLNLDVPTRTGTDATGTWGISVTGNANTATTWQTARTLTIGGTGKSVNGSANIAWSLAEIGAAATSHVHDTSDITTGTFVSARLSGSYTGITGTGALNAGSITSGFGNINIGSNTFTNTSSVNTPLLTNAGTLALSATGANIITASTNGSERLRITNAGNVGIGTTGPNESLDVRGSFYREAGGVANRMVSSGGVAYFQTGTGYTASSAKLVFTSMISTAPNLVVDNDTGNVGIGVINPNARLTVSSNIGQLALLDANSTDTTSTGGTLIGTNDGLFTIQGVNSSGSGSAIRIAINQMNGNVGIGTTSPGQKLDVSGGNIATNQALMFTGSGASSVSTGIHAASANTLVFRTSSSERLRIDSSGNVGIGITDPEQPLHVNPGRLAIAGQGSNDWISNVSYSAIYTTASGAAYPFESTVGHLIIQPRTNNLNARDIILATGATTPSARLVVKGNGNVGIGTTSPDRTLHVAGEANINNLRIGAVGVGGSWAGIRHNALSLEDSSQYALIQNEEGTTLLNAATSSSGLRFRIGNQDRLVLSPSGTFGIGTGAPLTLQHNRADSKYLLQLQRNSTAEGSEALIRFANSTNDDTYSAYIGSVRAAGSPAGRGDLVFGTNGTTASSDNISERMRITSTGNVGIGITSPTERLHVVGSTRLSDGGGTADVPALLVTRNNPGDGATVLDLQMGSNSSNRFFIKGIGSGSSVNFSVASNGSIYSSPLDGGATTLSADANGRIIRTPSDSTLKTNIKDINNAMDTILALRGVSFEWIDKDRFGNMTEIGFIAQEVDTVLPELVRKGGEYWALNTPNMLAVVIEAMKEMWEVVLGNKAKIAELENENQLIKQRLQVLESGQGSTSSNNGGSTIIVGEPTVSESNPEEGMTEEDEDETIENPEDDTDSDNNNPPSEDGDFEENNN
ncbi:MAG: tail fiber domain-containing protein [Candidatus Paceibacteria bacterium]